MQCIWNIVRAAHREEKGAEGLEKLLIVAAIVLPLLGLLIYFRDWITDWVSGEADAVRQEGDDYDYEDPGF
jgi:Flp pilus assembly pilin Flp